MGLILDTLPPFSPVASLRFGESLAKTNPLPNRYQYPVYYTMAITNNPLSRLWNFNERPCIVPHEIHNGPNVVDRALSPKLKSC